MDDDEDVRTCPDDDDDDDAATARVRRDRDRLRADEPTPAGAAVDGADRAKRGGKRRRKGGVLRETVIVVVSALLLSILIKTFLVQAFFIPSGSMEDTLAVGDRVFVSKLTPSPLDVNRGDVVVFIDPGGWLDHELVDRGPLREGVEDVLTFIGLLPQNAGEHLIKRVIGVGGDTVECCDAAGRLQVNGVGINEFYLKPGVVPSESEFSVTVPEDHFWLMGDNRSNSQDSRSHRGDPGGGAVPVGNVVGNAFLIMWPADHWTVLRSPGETFAQVPDR